MPQPTPYEIVLRGRASARLLRPLIDDFSIAPSDDARTHLVGDIRDASHLHGVLAHLTAVNVEVISIAPRPPLRLPAPHHDHTTPSARPRAPQNHGDQP